MIKPHYDYINSHDSHCIMAARCIQKNGVNKYKLNYDEFLVQQKCCVIMNLVGSVDQGYQALFAQ